MSQGGYLGQLACAGAVGQRRLELIARRDAQLAEDLAQVIGDGVLADDQARADLGVRQAVAGESRDLSLLPGELVTGLDAALADAFARGQQLALGAPHERLGTHAREHLERGAQLLAGVAPAALAAQPLAVEQVGAREIDAYACPSGPFDRLPVETVSGIAATEQRARTGLDAQRAIGAAGAGRLREPLERVSREVVLFASDGGLYQLGQGPGGRAFLVVAFGVADPRPGRVVATEPVVQDSAQELADAEREPLSSRPSLADRGLDQLRELGLAAA